MARVFAAGVAGCGALVGWNSFAIVPAGHVAVRDTFGVVEKELAQPGIYMKNPFTNFKAFSLRTQNVGGVAVVPSKEGLNVKLEGTVLFRVKESHILDIYKTVGMKYIDVLIDPHIRAITRNVTSSHEAKELYNMERVAMAEEVRVGLNNELGPKGIVVESCPFKSIGLPDGLRSAIEQKLQMEQEGQRMTFVLEKERLEAERKRVEAQGIADFQAIVTDGISEKLLKWKGIEATQQLANSQNAKLVVVGNGHDGLPLIMSHAK